jgi:hypothetical protein
MIKKIEQNIHRPPVQAALVLLGALLLMTVGWALFSSGLVENDRLFAWSISAGFMLLFAVFNSLMSIKSSNFARYWGSSMYSYLALALCSGGLAWVFSGVPLKAAGTYKWIYVVVTFGFLVFLSLVNTIKRIVNFAEREEWTAPRKRR